MTDTLHQLLKSCFDNPLERTPRDMVADYCQEEGIAEIVLDYTPQVVVISPEEAYMIASSRFFQQYAMYSEMTIREITNPNNRNSEWGFTEKVFGVEVYVDPGRKELPLSLGDDDAYLPSREFYDWVVAVWNDSWPEVKLRVKR